METYVLQGNRLVGYYKPDNAGHILPGPDGKIVYTARGTFGADVEPLEKRMAGGFCIPAAHGIYYLSFNLRDPLGFATQQELQTITVHSVEDARSIITPNKMDLGLEDTEQAKLNRNPTELDNRIWYVPDARMIVTLPMTNDRLIVHRVDLDEALEKADIDYLFVTSRERPSCVM